MLNINIRRNKWILFRNSEDNNRIIFKFRIIELGPQKSWIMIDWAADALLNNGTITLMKGDTRSFSYKTESQITQITVFQIKYIHGLPRGARARIGILAPKEIIISQEDRESCAK